MIHLRGKGLFSLFSDGFCYQALMDELDLPPDRANLFDTWPCRKTNEHRGFLKWLSFCDKARNMFNAVCINLYVYIRNYVYLYLIIYIYTLYSYTLYIFTLYIYILFWSFPPCKYQRTCCFLEAFHPRESF